jgi:hypothetical protein
VQVGECPLEAEVAIDRGPKRYVFNVAIRRLSGRHLMKQKPPEMAIQRGSRQA